MNENIPIDGIHLSELIRNPTVVRIVSILDLARRSILELNIIWTKRNKLCLIRESYTFDKLTTSWPQLPAGEMISACSVLLSGDYYYNFLSSKISLVCIY